jgi:hypothetical protein
VFIEILAVWVSQEQNQEVVTLHRELVPAACDRKPATRVISNLVPRAREQFEELPRRELLEALAHDYHALKTEHAGAPPESRVRHRSEGRLVETHERFERVLEEWVPEDDLRDAWREYLDNHFALPTGPPAIRPLVFYGRSDANSIVAVRGKRGDEFAVEIDGTLVERIAAEKDFAVPDPAHRFRLEGIDYEEMFNASPEALDALADFVADGGTPPWDYALELLSDGLIDVHFALTPRGRRALASR